jgi:crotonobetainyl-CoA:carnitine CoA-transferase CaiB-like acyl-CoA transferase
MTIRSAARIATRLVAAVLATAALAAPAMAEDAGHCQYVQQNMFAGPFKVCEMPIDAAQCEQLGKTDENKDAVHAAGACPTEAMVGTCDKGATKLVYYEGDPGSLEIGCGFQGGTWVNP